MIEGLKKQILKISSALLPFAIADFCDKDTICMAV